MFFCFCLFICLSFRIACLLPACLPTDRPVVNPRAARVDNETCHSGIDRRVHAVGESTTAQAVSVGKCFRAHTPRTFRGKWTCTTWCSCCEFSSSKRDDGRLRAVTRIRSRPLPPRLGSPSFVFPETTGTVTGFRVSFPVAENMLCDNRQLKVFADFFRLNFLKISTFSRRHPSYRPLCRPVSV